MLEDLNCSGRESNSATRAIETIVPSDGEDINLFVSCLCLSNSRSLNCSWRESFSGTRAIETTGVVPSDGEDFNLLPLSISTRFIYGCLKINRVVPSSGKDINPLPQSWFLCLNVPLGRLLVG